LGNRLDLLHSVLSHLKHRLFLSGNFQGSARFSPGRPKSKTIHVPTDDPPFCGGRATENFLHMAADMGFNFALAAI
jgi:hypothetical protein